LGAVPHKNDAIRRSPRLPAVAIGCAKFYFQRMAKDILKSAGIRIPGQVAVAGFNNDSVSRVVEPGLTTIHYPGQEMGEMAAKNLIHHLNGSENIDVTHTIVLRSQLVIRQSSLKRG
jgi:DNA-binding LacI/PurR family transcriptional regulator